MIRAYLFEIQCILGYLNPLSWTCRKMFARDLFNDSARNCGHWLSFSGRVHWMGRKCTWCTCVCTFSIYHQITENSLLPNNTMSVNGVNILLYLIGDSAYPLQTWLMKPFPRAAHSLLIMKQYNYRISRACIVVENTYGRLKGRWRRLMKRIAMHIDHIPNIVAAACILHNLCEIHTSILVGYRSWTAALLSLNRLFARDGSSGQAKRVRDALVHYFRSN